MNKFKVETYKDPSCFYESVSYDENSLHVVGSSALSMYMKSMNEFRNMHKNHIWTYANLQKSIYREWYEALNQIKLKIEIRNILIKVCKDTKIYGYLLNDIDSILSDYKFYITAGIKCLDNKVYASEQIRIVRECFNIFRNSTLVKELYYDKEVYKKEDIYLRLNKYYKEVLSSIGKDKEIKEITDVKRIYFYNLTHIDCTRFMFFKKLLNLGIEVIFRIPDDGFVRPWRKTYGFVNQYNWNEICSEIKNNINENKYLSYLNGKFDNGNNIDKRISFKEYIDPGEFKIKLRNSPIFQNNDQLKKWIVKNNSKIYINTEKNPTAFKRIREYLTFSKETYNDIFNGTILNYKDKRSNFFYFNEGRFLKGLYNSKWGKDNSYMLIDYDDYCDCILSGWIEIKTKLNVISGNNAADLLIDLKPYMEGTKSIDDIINRLYRLTYLHEFSSIFDNLSKEKTDGDRVKEYLYNPLKVISYTDNNRYEITVKQLIDLSKKLKKYLEDLIPKDNLINIEEHKVKLIEYWRSISYVSKIDGQWRNLVKEYNVNKSNENIKRINIFRNTYIQYVEFQKKLKKAEYIENLCTINEAKEYMKIVLGIFTVEDDDTEAKTFNYIKLFDQIEGIMLNGTREIYITDLSEKSINKYLKSRKYFLNYSDEESLKRDIKELNDVYDAEEINTIINQLQTSREEIFNFIKYYIAALISYTRAYKIEFSWIKGINDNDQESSIYKILLTLYCKDIKRKLYFDHRDKLLNKYKENKEKLTSIESNENSLYEINKIYARKTKMDFHIDIAPMAWIDLDICPNKFFLSGILNFYPTYESDFHQRIAFSILGKLLKSQFQESRDVEKYFYYLFPQWNKTMKDNFIETSYKREIRTEYKFKNIYFPYHMKDMQILRSRIYDNYRRKRKNAYKKMNINSEEYMKEFIKEDVKYDLIKALKGINCDMCPHNMICCKGEFAIERSNY